MASRFRLLTLGQCLLLGILAWSFWTLSADQSVRSYPSVNATVPSQAPFDYIVVIALNNASATQIYGASAAPYLNSLANTYGYATSYSDVAAKVSDPNYIALISGSTFGMTVDCYPTECPLNAVNIVDRLEASGISWKAWAEDYPVSQGCNLSPSSGQYNAKHFPFLYFQDIINNPTRCGKLLKANSVVSSSIETDDLFLQSLNSVSSAANYNWLTPNQCDDLHDCPLSTVDKYLSQLVPKILDSYIFTTRKAALFITTAEASGSSIDKVPAIWAGPAVKTKFKSSSPYDHYSFLKTIETAWQLSSISSKDESASAMTEFFNNVPPQTSVSYSPTQPVAGDSVSFSSTSTGGTVPYTYSWNFGDSPSNVPGGTNNPNTMTRTYSRAGTYTVKVNATDSRGYIGYASTTITVGAALAVRISGPSSSTVGTSVTFTASTSGGTSPYSYTWNFGDATGTTSGTSVSVSHTFVAIGTYNVTVTATDAKSRLTLASNSITVNPPVLAVTVTGPSSGEVGVRLNFTATASGGTPPYASFNWNFGDGSTGSGSSAGHTYLSPGTYSVTITLKDSRGITTTSSVYSVLVAARLQLSSVSGSPNPSEVGFSIQLTATTSGGSSPVTCIWDFGDGSHLISGCSNAHAYTSSGTFTATVTATDSLGVTATGSVALTVSPKLWVAAAANPNPTEVGSTTAFTGSTADGVGNASCRWIFGDGGTASTCSSFHIYTTAGTFTATITASDSIGVIATSDVTVTVHARLTVTASAAPANPGVGETENFTAIPTGGVGSVTCAWNFGDSTTGTGCSTTHAYLVQGNYTAKVTGTDALGVTATYTVGIDVGNALSVTLVVSPNPNELPRTTVFNATSRGGTPPYLSYDWIFGDGRTATTTTSNVSHAYISAGTFTATVTVVDSAGKQATSHPAVSITINPILSLTAGASPLTTEVNSTVRFSALTAGGVGTLSCSWIFGDTSTGTGCSTTHIYSIVGIFTATVTATDSLGAIATGNVSVTVSAKLAVAATATPNPTEVGIAVGFGGPTSGGVGTTSCGWIFGDGGTASTCSSSHIYTTAGTFIATVTAMDSIDVTASSTVTVTIRARVTVTANAVPTNPGVGETENFTAIPTGGVGSVTCAWNFGDSTTAIGCSSPHAYLVQGNYTATITGTDELGVTATAEVQVDVGSVLGVTLAVNPNPNELPRTTVFNATARGGTPPYTSYVWAFGDGTTATTTNSTVGHIYNSSGTFAPTVTVSDSAGKMAASRPVLSVTINAKLALTAAANPLSTEVNSTVSFSTQTTGGVGIVTCSWSFGDTSTGNSCSTTHIYSVVGVFTATVTATDNLGVIAAGNVSVTVTARLVVAAVATPNPTEVGIGVGFGGLSNGGVGIVSCRWIFGDGGAASTCSSFHPYTTTGTFTATVTATDSIDVTADSTVTVTVLARVAVTANAAPTNPGVRQPENFTAIPTGGVGTVTCAWDFGDSTSGVGCSATHSYLVQGNYTATVTSTDGLGVTATATVQVIVGSVLGVTLVVVPNPNELTRTTVFNATASGGTPPYLSYDWIFGDGTTATTANSTLGHIYNSSGTFAATVTVVDSAGKMATSHPVLSVTINAKLALTAAANPLTTEINSTVSFSASTTGGVGTPSCTWSFGDTSTGTGCSTTHIYSTVGRLTVTVTATDSLGVTATSNVFVNVNPALAVTVIASPNPTDIDVPVSYSSVSTGGVGVANCSWSFGDTAQATGCSTSHIYATAGNFTVTVTLTDEVGVVSVASTTVTVNPAPRVDFTISPTKPMAGEPLTVTAATIGGTNSFTFDWSFGDAGSSSGNPVSHSYATNGTFIITVTATDAVGTTATFTRTVSITPSFRVSIVVTGPSPSEVGVPVSLAAVVAGGTPPYTLNWNFGDGSPAASGSHATHTYASGGTFIITLGSDDSAIHTRTTSQSLIVNARLELTVAASLNPTDVGIPVRFSPIAIGGTNILACSWDFGDGWSANGCSTTHTYGNAGSFPATVIVTDSLGVDASALLLVTVHTAPNVEFSFSPTNPTAGHPVTFTAMTTGGMGPFSYNWTYGDGSPDDKTNLETHIHTFVVAGKFKIALLSQDANGASTTSTLTIDVAEDQPPVFSNLPESQTVSAEESLTFTVAASDPEGGPIFMLASSLPYGAHFETETGQFSWTPTAGQTGNYTIMFTATDNGTPANAASQSITIRVEPSSGRNCQICYRILGIVLDDRVLTGLGFLVLLSALAATIFAALHNNGESEYSTKRPPGDDPHGNRRESPDQMTSWMRSEC